ncbi:MAG: glycosyl transferase family 2 [Frankiales bacterium]|nr:glycosyl transferase family 2 [Frankiales bacterium]
MSKSSNNEVQVPPRQDGVVSIVIVNYRGAADTIECLSGLATLDWPSDQLQIVVVDNASGDDSVPQLRAAAPGITLVESSENTGFAGGCNLGVAHSVGEFVAFINSDARPDAGWLREAVTVLRRDRTIAAVASKVLDWDGTLVDYTGGNVNFIGQGYKLGAGQPDTSQAGEHERDVLFPTGSAAVLRTSTFRELGGFDESFFMFFEDLDLGWRINLAGLRVRYVPSSLVFHKHHAAIAKFGSYREQYLLARNGLLTIYKNFDDENLAAALAPALLLTVHSGIAMGGADPTALDLQRSAGGDDQPELTLDKQALTGAYAVDYLMRNLGEISASRTKVQRTRKRSDSALAPLFGDLLQATGASPGYHAAWLSAVKVFGLDQALVRRRRIAVITADTLAPQMAGPAIRAFHIADELAAEHEVTLVSTTTCALDSDRFRCVKANGPALRRIVEGVDIVIFQGFVMHHEPWLRDSDAIVVVDIYDPMHLEQLEQGKDIDAVSRRAEIISTTQVINEQLERGDFFLCASEEQRHFWLGQLAAVGRVNPDNYDRDSSLRSLLAVSPFGLSDEPPVRTRSAIKGFTPGIGVDDKVILWGGGVYNWFDPLTLILSIDVLRQTHDDVRLFFLGMKHPNPNVPEMKMAWECRQLSDRLGLTDKFVFFNEQWVEYADRPNYLLDADLGVSTHLLHVETTFSFRTRMLDYLWAGLPIVATEGDSFARLIAAEKLGVVVGERDVPALAAGLERALYDDEFVAECRLNVARVREQFTWGRALAPLLDFCRTAETAADSPEGSPRARYRGRAAASVPENPIGRNLYYARARVREGGVGFAAKQGVSKLRRIVADR